MGYGLLIGEDTSSMAELRLASELGNACMADLVCLTHSSQPTLVIAAGGILFGRPTFVTFWMWLMIGNSVYRHILEEDLQSMNELERYNVPVFKTFPKSSDSRAIAVGYTYRLLKNRFGNLSNMEKNSMFDSVLDDWDQLQPRQRGSHI